jgi:nucleoside-diphosphate-sugar epimerase
MKILIIGGRGFVGTAICDQLRKHKVYTFDRNKGGKYHFRGSILSDEDLIKATKGMNIVINLVGLSPVLNYSEEKYMQIHFQGTKNVIKAIKKK